MMAAIPGPVAGVGEICVCASPGPDGRVCGWVLAVAGLLGLGEVYAVGGAQALGAMAFGTETVGPGNDYVTAASWRSLAPSAWTPRRDRASSS